MCFIDCSCMETGNCEELYKPLISGEVCWCFMHVPSGSPKDYTLKLESVMAS